MSSLVRTPAIAVLGVVVIAAALWFTNRPGPAPVKAGDCVTAPAGGKFAKVGCADQKAGFLVLREFDGTDGNQCDQDPGTVEAVRETTGAKQSVLCLGVKK